jgi:hypothetical protein
MSVGADKAAVKAEVAGIEAGIAESSAERKSSSLMPYFSSASSFT